MSLFRRATPVGPRAACRVGPSAPAERTIDAPPSLSMTGIAALRQALVGCAAGPGQPGGNADLLLASAAGLLADAARRSDPVRAERLVIALKSLWALLPEARQLPGGGAREAVWSRFVTLAIEAFYAAPREVPAGIAAAAVPRLASPSLLPSTEPVR